MSDYLIIGLAALVVLLIGIIISKNFSGSFNGLFIKKTEGKDNISISKIRNKSDVDVNTKNGQDIDIKDVDKSKIKINKSKK